MSPQAWVFYALRPATYNRVSQVKLKRVFYAHFLWQTPFYLKTALFCSYIKASRQELARADLNVLRNGPEAQKLSAHQKLNLL